MTLSTAAFRLYYCLVEAPVICFLSWVLFEVFKSSSAVVRTESARERRPSIEILPEQVLCPWIFHRYKAIQVTMGFAVASVAFFLLSAVFAAAYSFSYFLICRSCVVRCTVQSLATVFLVLGYALMLVTHFERMRHTFTGTPLQLPRWAPKALYCIALTFFLLGICAAIFLHIDIVISAMCGVFLLLLYFSVITWIIHSFYTKTLGIATHGEGRVELIDTVVRVAVVVTVSLLSTTIAIIQYVTVLVLCYECLWWQLVAWALLELDIALNAFCLMCTFGDAKYYYRKVFGRLHAWVLEYRKKRCNCELAPANSDSVVNSGASFSPLQQNETKNIELT